MSTQTIFVIDDHAAVRDALGEMLSVFGYTVKTFESADHFLREFDAGQAGCIVADVKMPGTDGIGLVRELDRPGLPVDVVSAAWVVSEESVVSEASAELARVSFRAAGLEAAITTSTPATSTSAMATAIGATAGTGGATIPSAPASWSGP